MMRFFLLKCFCETETVSSTKPSVVTYSEAAHSSDSFSSGFQVVKDYPAAIYGLAVQELLDKPEYQTRLALFYLRSARVSSVRQVDYHCPIA